MADFDASSYFARRLGTASADKAPSITDAMARKVAGLQRYREALGTQTQPAEEASLVGRLGLDPEGVAGTLVNLGANVAEGVANLPLNIGIGIHTGAALHLDAGLDDAVKAAAARQQAGSATPEDAALLAAPARRADPQRKWAAQPSQARLAAEADGSLETNQQRVALLRERLADAQAIRDVKEQTVAPLVQRDRQRALEGDLRDGFQENMAQVQEGGIGNVTAGIAGLFSTIGAAAMTNPVASLEYIAANAPQLVLAAGGAPGLALTNLPYAMDEFGKGIAAYQKAHDGALPPAAEMDRMGKYAASLALAETLGDKVALGAGNVGRVLSPRAARQALKASLLNNGATRVGGAVVEGAAGEFGTEAYQTFAENAIQGKATTLEDSYVGGAIGAISGGGLSGGLRTVAEASGTTPEQQTARQQTAAARERAQAVQDAAIASGDVTALTDPASPHYAPANAIAALVGNSTAPGVTPAIRQANLEKARGVLHGLESRLAQVQNTLAPTTPAGRATLAQEVATYREQAAAATDPDDVALYTQLANATQGALDAPAMDAKTAKARQAEATALQDQATAAQAAMGILEAEHAKDGTADAALATIRSHAPEAPAAAERLMNLAMASDYVLDAETALELAGMPGLSPAQQQYFRAFSTARQAANAARDLDLVSREVLDGSPANMGIATYRKQMAAALAAGNDAASQALLTGIDKFDEDHANKAQAAQAAWNGGAGRGTQIVSDGNRGWRIHTGTPLTREALTKNGGLSLESQRLVDAIVAESAALSAAAAELQAAYNNKFGVNQGGVDVQNAPSGQAGQSPPPPAAAPVPATQAAADGVAVPATATGRGPAAVAPGAALQTPSGSLNRNVEAESTAPEATSTSPAGLSAGVEGAEGSIPSQVPQPAGAPAAPAVIDRVPRLRQEIAEISTHIRQGTVPFWYRNSGTITDDDILQALDPGGDLLTLQDIQSEIHAMRADPRGLRAALWEVEQKSQLEGRKDLLKTLEDRTGNAPAAATASPPPEAQPTGSAAASGAQPATGKLTVLQQPQTREPGSKLQDLYRTMNRAATWLRQKAAPVATDADIVKARPLVDVANLLARWQAGDVTPESFFPDALTDLEQQALSTFLDFATTYAPEVRASFRKSTAHPDYVHEDPLQDFLGPDGEVDENLVTAVLYGAYSWVTDTAFGAPLKSGEAILAMHGQPETAYLSEAGLAQLSRVDAVKDAAVNSLGRAMADALGLVADKAAPVDYLPKVQAALGVHGLQLLERQGLVKMSTLGGETLNSFMPSLGYTPRQSITYVALVRGSRANGYALPDATQQIRDAAVGAQNVLDRFFGAEKVPTAASWKPLPFVQATAKRTDAAIPAAQRKILEQAQQTPHRVIPAMWHAVAVLGDDVVLRAAGWREEDATRVQAENRKAVEVQNRNLENQLDSAKALVESAIAHSPKGLAQPFYLAQEVWRNFRVGIATRNLNPQSSKIHRFLFARPEWESTLQLDDANQVRHFEVALAQAFGVKIDTMGAQDAADAFMDALREPGNRTIELATALHRATQGETSNPELLTAEQKDAIGNLAAGAEGMQTLQALGVLGQYLAARNSGAESFTFTLLVGVDGKTNGPMFSLLALGAGATPEALAQQLERGGFYGEGAGFTNFNQWYAQGNQADLYEDLAAHLLSGLRDAMAGPNPALAPSLVQDFFLIAKDLLADKKAARNVVKTPLTAFGFGSSIESAAASMARDFSQALFDRIEDVAAGKPGAPTRPALIAAINRMLVTGGIAPQNLLPADLPLEDLVNLTFPKAYRNALATAFQAILGNRVQGAMETYFATFIERRDRVNATVRAGFAVYHSTYQALRAAEVARLMAAGEIATQKDHKTGQDVPLHDLTQAQEDALQQQVAAILPRAHSAYTQPTGELQAGLYMAKTRTILSPSPAYRVKVQLGQAYTGPSGKSVTSMDARAQELTEQDPGVAALSYFIHALDSATMHSALAGTESLNVHDEAGNGATRVVNTARRINGAAWDKLLHFSPAAEALAMLERSITGAVALLATTPLPADARAALAASLRNQLPAPLRKKVAAQDVPMVLLNLAKANQVAADTLRLTALGKMASVDQYTWEGGEYRVTPADRKEAAALLQAAQQQTALSPESAAAATRLGQLLTVPAPVTAAAAPATPVAAQLAPAAPEVAAQDIYNDLGQPLTERDRNLALVRAPLVIASAVEALGNAPALQAVADAVASGTPILTALGALEDGTQRAALVEEITRQAFALPPRVKNPWGPLGKSPYHAPDTYLVEFFARHPQPTVGQVLASVARQLGDSRTDRLYKALIGQLQTTPAVTIPVHYVTPATAPDALPHGPRHGSRGWYSPRAGGGVYVLAPDFFHSGLTTELLLHEIVHAALAGIVDQAQQRPASVTPAVRAMVAELEALRQAAATRIGTDPALARKYAARVKNVHELLAYGLTDTAFQNDVLAPLRQPTRHWGLLSGMQAFIKSVARLLFARTATESGAAYQERVASSALTTLVANAAGLMAAVTAAGDQYVQQERTYDMEDAPGATRYSTGELFAALDDGTVAPALQSRLGSLLESLVTRLHGPLGTTQALQASRSGTSPLDMALAALDAGQAPFASQVMAAPFTTPRQVAFVLEQVEATVKAAMDAPTAPTRLAYRELAKLYEQARKRITVADFLPAGATPPTLDQVQAATAMHGFLFGVAKTHGDRSDYLARFAALGLTHPQVQPLLNFASASTAEAAPATFAERLQHWFERLLEMVTATVTRTRAGELAATKLESLVGQLVGIEAKYRRTQDLRSAGSPLVEKFEQQVGQATRAMRARAERLAASDWVRQHSSAVVRAAGGVARTVAGDRVDAFIDNLQALRNRAFDERPGLAMGLVNALRGPTAQLLDLLRTTKALERQRKAVITTHTQMVLAAFADQGRGMTRTAKAAVTQAFLRSGAHVLLDHVSAAELGTLLHSSAARQQQIADLTRQLQQDPDGALYAPYYARQANALGHYKATGRVTSPLLMLNASNIARLLGTGQPPPQVAAAARVEPIIAALAALHALDYLGADVRSAAHAVLHAESARADGENGVLFLLKLHQRLEADAKERLFDQNATHMVHGFTPEITNPHHAVVAATEAEADAQGLAAQGYVKGAPVAADARLGQQEARFLYIQKEGGLAPWASGIFSFTGQGTKGSTIHSGYLNLRSAQGVLNAALQAQVTSRSQQEVAALFAPGAVPNLAQVAGSRLAPVLDAQGNLVNWRHMMTEHTKDTALERDNRFEHILGALAGSLYDKSTAPDQNRQVVQALHDAFAADYARHPAAFMQVGPKSADPEMREIWNLLPDATRADVKRIWGEGGMFVKKEALDVVFGYRKLSLADALRKDPAARKEVEKLFAFLMEGVFGKKAALRVAQGERAWQEVVKEVKDLIVVKSGMVLLGNVWSNLSLLALQGVPLKDLAAYHLTAFRGATAYQKDSAQLERLRLAQRTQTWRGDATELANQILRLEDALARNPVAGLIEAGLMPTIVEDVALEDDPYSYKSAFARRLDRVTGKLPPAVNTAARWVYMTHDTPLYQGLSRLTQLSDFVARYALVQHLTTRKTDPLPKMAAIRHASDAFVNYDVPLHRSLQYTDDMGFTMFSKYFLYIQRVLAKTMKEQPARVLTMLLLGKFVGLGPIVLDSAMLTRVGNFPFDAGALQFPGAIDELATVQSVLSLLK
jgi:hypothetical protein